jgi:hypothetical protein
LSDSLVKVTFFSCKSACDANDLLMVGSEGGKSSIWTDDFSLAFGLPQFKVIVRLCLTR